ncbi:nucleotidyltransferase family protein [Candidatus Uabimicrobium amorphum]|uniref:Nucleotidyltransferase family protein n=1 Tax=Uabimicrobium amorphum TaxID=2596890 RepID=A0A5S9IT71_UABAM|nr:nucleotidyltransferase family protein [Candidatus Uabimicrobium amorphum]BBM87708.1 hypothetical protein UABAM_06123 [Candidatus Uabimicrobium amorphum]
MKTLGARPSADMDLFVKPQKFTAAQSLLESHGYSTQGATSGYAVLYIKQSPFGNFNIELHRQLMGIPFGQNFYPFGLKSASGLGVNIWSRAKLICEDNSYWQMDVNDEFLYLCLHLAKHIPRYRAQAKRKNCLPNQGIMLCLDIAQAAKIWKQVDWELCQQRADELGLLPHLAVAIAYVRDWLGYLPMPLPKLSKNIEVRIERYHKKQQKRFSLIHYLPFKMYLLHYHWTLACNFQARWGIFVLSLRKIYQRIKSNITSKILFQNNS